MKGKGLGYAPLACEELSLRQRLQERLEALLEGEQHPGTQTYLERVLTGVQSATMGLPHFPEVARELDELLSLDEPNDRDILRSVEKEPALVHDVWRISSTAPYTSAPRRLEQAITRVGLDRLWQLGVRQALRSEIFMAPGYDAEVARCRRAATAGALVAGWLAGQGRGPVYLATLLRDLGELWLYSRVVGEGPRDRPRREMVEHLVTTLHPSFTCLALRVWGMGSSVAVPAGFHHAPARAPSHQGETAFVGLADMAVRAALEPELRQEAATWLRPWLGDAQQVTRVLQRAQAATEAA